MEGISFQWVFQAVARHNGSKVGEIALEISDHVDAMMKVPSTLSSVVRLYKGHRGQYPTLLHSRGSDCGVRFGSAALMDASGRCSTFHAPYGPCTGLSRLEP
jgi:hypothetical protein